MKKLFLIATFVLAAQSIWAQTVVSAADFKSNPAKYVGQTITINNVKLVSNRPPKSTVGAANIPCGKVLNMNTPGGSGTDRGKTNTPTTVVSSPAHCNDIPNFHLTKWELAAGNEICVQMCYQLSSQLQSIPAGTTVKSVTIEVKETLYVFKQVAK